MIEFIFNRFVWFILSLPFCPMTLNSKRWVNKRSAANTISVCAKIGLVPTAVFDVGANESQWTYWLRREWPCVAVHSFEPQSSLEPWGMVHHVALSDSSSIGRIKGKETSATIQEIEVKEIGCVPVDRFDNYFKGGIIPKGSLLKIDAEAHTARALVGFGERINDFDLVVIEVCFDDWHGADDFTGQAHIVFEFMQRNGFNRMHPVDTDYFSGHCNFCDIAFWKSKR